MSPRERAFVKESNAMVVIRTKYDMQTRERKARRLERAVATTGESTSGDGLQ